MESPLVSVLIIAWNRKNETIKSIEDVYGQSYRNFEVVLVDNGSNDGTVEAVRGLYPQVKTIALEKNSGIAARNAGIAISKGEIILCLDSDASPGRESISNVVRKFQADPKLGVINSKIVNALTNRLDAVAGWSYSEKDKEDQDKEFLSSSFSEGGAAIRSELFSKVGCFWEPLFFGCEGFEFSLRVLDAGYNILYFPDSIIYHRVASESRIQDGRRDSLFFRNFLYIYLLRFPWWLMGLYLPLKTAASFIRGIRRGYLRDMFRSFLEFLENIPFLLRERQPIRNETAWMFLDLQRQHGSLRWDLASWLKYKS
jgi:GT2 family glycosyltransferase